MYLDLEYETRTNGQFKHKLLNHLGVLGKYRLLAKENQSYLPKFQEQLLIFMRFCNLNPVYMTPYFWPRYPKDEPLSFADYPFAFQMFEFQVGGFTVFRGSRQISKSTSFCCRQQMFTRLIPGFKSLYIVPRNDQLETYQNKMREIEHAIAGFSKRRDPDLRKNLGLKEFANGSSIEMAYVLSSASNVRGKSSDEILYDENQDFDPDLEIEVAQIQSAATFPITIYAGTSLTTDTMLERKWSESSGGLWITKCTHCNHYNVPLPDQGVLDMIQPEGPACCKCIKPIDVRTGKFIHSYPNKVAAGRYGFHIPQIIMPSVVKNPIRWAKIYEMKLKQGGNRKFLQEVLGIAVEEGEREITKKNLMDICILGRDLNRLQQKAAQGGYEYVISGEDWGGSDYIPAQHIKISTTVHVIVGVTPSGQFDILHIRRYSGMNYDDIVGDILQNHGAYRGVAMASDFGVGAVYNSKLREKIPPEKHLIFNYVGPASNLITEPKKAHMFNQWSLNKTESISLTYEAIRQARIRCFAWEIAEEYLMDCLNLFRAPGERQSSGGNSSGASTFLYRAHPSKPNDTLMALNYAYMLGKILLGEPMFADLTLKLRLEQTLRSNLGYAHINLPGAFSG